MLVEVVRDWKGLSVGYRYSPLSDGEADILIRRGFVRQVEEVKVSQPDRSQRGSKANSRPGGRAAKRS